MLAWRPGQPGLPPRAYPPLRAGATAVRASADRHGDGSYARLMTQLLKKPILLILGWTGHAEGSMAQATNRIDGGDRGPSRTWALNAHCQPAYPPEHWHDYIGSATLADRHPWTGSLHGAHRSI